MKVALGLLLAAAAWWAAANMVPPEPLQDDYHLAANLFQQRLYIFEDGEMVRALPMMVSAEGRPAPGVYPVVRRLAFDLDERGVQGVLGTHWLGLGVPGDALGEDGLRYGIHGTPTAAGSPAGAPAPHGALTGSGGGACMALLNPHVVELHDMTPPGTPVYLFWGLPWHDIFHYVPFDHPTAGSAAASDGCVPPVVTVEGPRGPTADPEPAPSPAGRQGMLPSR